MSYFWHAIPFWQAQDLSFGYCLSGFLLSRFRYKVSLSPTSSLTNFFSPSQSGRSTYVGLRTTFLKYMAERLEKRLMYWVFINDNLQETKILIPHRQSNKATQSDKPPTNSKLICTIRVALQKIQIRGWRGVVGCFNKLREYDVCDTTENNVQQYDFRATNAMESDFGVGVVDVGVGVAQWQCPTHSTHRETLWRQKWADLSCVHVDKWPPYPTLLPPPPTGGAHRRPSFSHPTTLLTLLLYRHTRWLND